MVFIPSYRTKFLRCYRKAKLKAFSFGPEDFENLDRLCQKLGWNGSKVVRELLACAQVVQHPAVCVEVPSAVTLEEPADVSG